MTNRTTPGKGGLLAAVATYLALKMGMEPEAAALFTGVVTAVVAAVLPVVVTDGDLLQRLKRSIGMVVVLALIGGAGCTFIATSNSDGKSLQMSLLDRLPGSDQQHETSTVTGFSLRDFTLGIGQRDVTRNPVDREPLYGVGLRRTQDVQTGLGDGIESDLTSGDAFEPDLTGTAE